MSRRELLADVYEAYRADRRFDHLRLEHIVLVAGDGPSRPKLFIVGEAPGAMENTLRRPFVGASGSVLRSLMQDVAEVDINRAFLTNVVKYRPPNNRVPTRDELVDSIPYLRREYAAVGSPDVIVALGGSALTALAPPHSNLGSLSHSGEPVTLPGGKALWPMIHPAYGLRVRAARDRMEQDWERFGQWFREEIR